MINILKIDYKISITYAVNSILFFIKNIPIFSDFFNDSIYKNKTLKVIALIISLFLTIFYFIVFKSIYFGIIYYISTLYGNLTNNFIFIYIVLSILGLFINSNFIVSTSLNKYFSINIFNINPREYTKVSLIKIILENFIFNILLFYLFNSLLKIPMYIILLLIFFNILFKIIGEAFNLNYFYKYGVVWYSKTSLYLFLVSLFFGIALLSYFGIYFDSFSLFVLLLISLFFFFISLSYLNNFKFYKFIYKILNSYDRVMNIDNGEEYNTTNLINIDSNDIYIDSNKFKNKKGYDLFNFIFFERHKSILYRKIKIESVVLIFIYLLLIYFGINNDGVKNIIINIFKVKLSLFFIVVMFLNKTVIMTQAMFYNCDNVMLTYNFYKDKRVIIKLYFYRLLYLLRANFLPILIMIIGNSILTYLFYYKDFTFILLNLISIILLMVVFTVHYLSLYYLLKPYNKDTTIININYMLVNSIFGLVTFASFKINMNIILFLIFSSIFSIIYSLILILLVIKYSYKTFNIK